MKTLLILIFTVLPSTLLAKRISFDATARNSFSLDILSSSQNKTVLRFKLNWFDVNNIDIQNEEYASINVKGMSKTDLKGLPEMPYISKHILIPSGAVPSIKVNQLYHSELELGPVAPSVGTVERCGSTRQFPTPNQSFYQGVKTFPKEITTASKPFTLRDFEGTRLRVSPFIYDPKTKKTTVVRELTLTITANGTLQVKSGDETYNRSFSHVYQNFFLNKQPINRLPTVVGEVGDLLVISHSNFKSGLDPFVAWKNQLGYNTKVVTLAETGSDYQSIKSFIRNEYEKNPRLAFVLLVGDSKYVPFHRGSAGNANGAEADPLYGLVAGDDTYPDLIVGRFSVNSSDELERITTRSINYEKNPEPGDWYSSATGIASNEGSPKDWERADRLREVLLTDRYLKVDQLYDPRLSSSKISEALNEGRGYVNYLGHGSTSSWATGQFGNSAISRLGNTKKLPMIISVACLNGHFASSGGDAFAEAWLKAGTVQDPKGAIAVFASSTNQSWVPPTVGQRYIAEYVAAETFRTVGGLMLNGSLAVLEDGSSTAEQTFQTWHIFGDPTLELRTRTPQELALGPMPASTDLETFVQHLDVGEGQLLVTLTQGDKILAKSFSNPNGSVSFKHAPFSTLKGTVKLTVSGINRIPYERVFRN